MALGVAFFFTALLKYSWPTITTYQSIQFDELGHYYASVKKSPQSRSWTCPSPSPKVCSGPFVMPSSSLDLPPSPIPRYLWICWFYRLVCNFLEFSVTGFIEYRLFLSGIFHLFIYLHNDRLSRCFYASVSPWLIPRSRMVGSHISWMFQLLRNCLVMFHNFFSGSSTSSQKLDMVYLSNFRHSGMSVVISQCD